MPFKDSDYNRDYQREWATKRREAKRAAEQDAHPLGPLGWEGERLIAKWIRKGESLLNKMIYNAQWQQTHKEELALYNSAYQAQNKSRIRLVQTQWVEKNKETHSAYKSQWAKDNKDKMAAAVERRRARKRNAPINDLTAAQWREIKAAYNYRCVYCPPDCKACKNKTHKLAQEHLTPLSKNGSNTVANVVPACKSCNSKKHDGPVLSPVQPLLLTVASSKPPKSA